MSLPMLAKKILSAVSSLPIAILMPAGLSLDELAAIRLCLDAPDGDQASR